MVVGFMLEDCICKSQSQDRTEGARSCNSKSTRDWISKENTSSPTVGTDSIMMTCVVDAFERRDVMTSDVQNKFIQTDAPEKEIGERVIMKIRGKLVD